MTLWDKMDESPGKTVALMIISGIIGIALIFLAIGLFFPNFGDNSTGIREGTLIKLSFKGWIWQTWEVELAMQGFTGIGDQVSPYVFDFTICDKDPAKIKFIQDHLGKKVQLAYDSPLLTWKWIQKTGYCLDSINETIGG